MSWQEPIFDRVQADVVVAKQEQSITTTEMKGSVDYRTWNRIEGNTGYVADALVAKGYSISVTTKTDWRRLDVLTLDDFNRMIGNLNLLKETLYLAAAVLDDSYIGEGLTVTRINALEHMVFEAEGALRRMLKLQWAGITVAGGVIGL